MVIRFWHQSVDDVKNYLDFYERKCSPFFIQKLSLHETNCHQLDIYVLCATRPEKMISSLK